jgi:hypothetical protein
MSVVQFLGSRPTALAEVLITDILSNEIYSLYRPIITSDSTNQKY